MEKISSSTKIGRRERGRKLRNRYLPRLKIISRALVAAISILLMEILWYASTCKSNFTGWPVRFSWRISSVQSIFSLDYSSGMLPGDYRDLLNVWVVSKLRSNLSKTLIPTIFSATLIVAAIFLPRYRALKVCLSSSGRKRRYTRRKNASRHCYSRFTNGWVDFNQSFSSSEGCENLRETKKRRAL